MVSLLGMSITSCCRRCRRCRRPELAEAPTAIPSAWATQVPQHSSPVLIGIPYQGASACDKTYHLLESWVAISNWQCVGNDILNYISMQESGSVVTSIMDYKPPSTQILRVVNFNCPDE